MKIWFFISYSRQCDENCIPTPLHTAAFLRHYFHLKKWTNQNWGFFILKFKKQTIFLLQFGKTSDQFGTILAIARVHIVHVQVGCSAPGLRGQRVMCIIPWNQQQDCMHLFPFCFERCILLCRKMTLFMPNFACCFQDCWQRTLSAPFGSEKIWQYRYRC